MKKNKKAFTLIELLVVIAISRFCGHAPAGPRCRQEEAQKINCVNNLKQVGLAVRIWEGDNTTRIQWNSPECRRAVLCYLSSTSGTIFNAQTGGWASAILGNVWCSAVFNVFQ